MHQWVFVTQGGQDIFGGHALSFVLTKRRWCMQIIETYDLPPPALSGSGSKGTSQLLSAPGNEIINCFRLCRQMESRRD